MKTVHILRGAGERGKLPPGQCIRLTDDLTEGILHRERYLNQQLRAAYLQTSIRDMEQICEAVTSLREFDEIVVWHGPSHADQLMLAWLVPLLRALGVDSRSVCLASPRNRRDQVLSPTEADGRDLLRGYMARSEMEAKLEALLDRLWKAITADTPVPLLEVSDADLLPLPYWNQARHAFLARYPDATGLGFHDRTLLSECTRRWKPASKVISGACEYSRDLAPITPQAAWRRLTRMIGNASAPGAVAIRSEGRLSPEQCEVRLTELGVQGVLGSTDVLADLPLYEWVGGCLLQSPDRIWRWSEKGLLPDHPELWPHVQPIPAEPEPEITALAS